MKVIWCLFVMLLSMALNAMTTLSLNGATIGIASKQDQLVWHNVSKLSSDELTELCWNYFQQHLKPVADVRALTGAEYRMLLLCAFSEMCNASALQTELFRMYMYDRDEKEYGCGVPLRWLTTVDEARLERMEKQYASPNYRNSETYKRYVQDMKFAIYDDFKFKDSDTGKQLPTDIDYLIIKGVLLCGVTNSISDGGLQYLEQNFNRDAVLWDRYHYIMKGSWFPKAWTALRRHYKQIESRLSVYRNALKNQVEMASDTQMRIDRKKFFDIWGEDIESVRVKLHRCVYDAPYTLLVTLENRLLSQVIGSNYDPNSLWDTAFSWLDRNERRVREGKARFLMFSEQLVDVEDVMSNLTTKVAILQTERTITLLKAILGSAGYNALREQSQLLKRMHRVSQGKWDE